MASVRSCNSSDSGLRGMDGWVRVWWWRLTRQQKKSPKRANLAGGKIAAGKVVAVLGDSELPREDVNGGADKQVVQRQVRYAGAAQKRLARLQVNLGWWWQRRLSSAVGWVLWGVRLVCTVRGVCEGEYLMLG